MKYELYKITAKVEMREYDSNEFYGTKEPWISESCPEHVGTFSTEQEALNHAYTYKGGAYIVHAETPYYVVTEFYIKATEYNNVKQETEEISCIPVSKRRRWGIVLEDPEHKGRMTKQAVRTRTPWNIKTRKDLDAIPASPGHVLAADMMEIYAYLPNSDSEIDRVGYITDLQSHENPEFFNSERFDVYKLLVVVKKNNGSFPRGHIIDYRILYAKKDNSVKLEYLIKSKSYYQLEALKTALWLNEIDGDNTKMWTYDILEDDKNSKPMNYEIW